MDDHIDPLDDQMVDRSLLPILGARIGTEAAAALLDDLAHRVLTSSSLMLAAFGQMDEYDEPPVFFEMIDSAQDDLHQGGPGRKYARVLRYRVWLGPGVSWTGRRLIVKGALPETVTSGLVGRPLSALIAHPQLSPDLIIDRLSYDEDTGETSVAVGVESCPPMTVGQALAQVGHRTTPLSRTMRKVRRQLAHSSDCRGWSHSIATMVPLVLLALTIGSLTGVLLTGFQASFTLICLTVAVPCFMWPGLRSGFCITPGDEIDLCHRYSSMARETRRLIESGGDATRTFEFVSRATGALVRT